jgi:hypothetical protein
MMGRGMSGRYGAASPLRGWWEYFLGKGDECKIWSCITTKGMVGAFIGEG